MREHLIQAWKEILQQDGFAITEHETCLYSFEGKHCVIGKLLAPHLPDVNMRELFGHVGSYPVWPALNSFYPASPAYVELLSDSQALHDRAAKNLAMHHAANVRDALVKVSNRDNEAGQILREALNA